METFKASTHYCDWEGSAAAADGVPASLEEHLKGKGLIMADEFLVATSLWVDENDGDEIGGVFVQAFIFKGGPDTASVQKAIEAVEGPVPVRAVQLEMTLKEFVCMFKEFEGMLTWQGLPLEGREYYLTEE